jgi:hypothetical protein
MFLSQYEEKTDRNLGKGSDLRFILNIDGSPIISKSDTHPSYSEDSHLLTSSLSFGTFSKRENKPDFDVKTRLKDTHFVTLFLKFHVYGCVLVKGGGQPGVQSEWVGTTWFRGLVEKDLSFEFQEVRYVLQSPRKCSCVDTGRKQKKLVGTCHVPHPQYQCFCVLISERLRKVRTK